MVVIQVLFWQTKAVETKLNKYGQIYKYNEYIFMSFAFNILNFLISDIIEFMRKYKKSL